MKPAEKIKRLIKARRYKASPEVYDKGLGGFLQAVDKHLEQKAARPKPNLWRTIMTSKMTKLAAAVLILIAAYIVLHQSGGSIDVTTVSFAQITENMKQMPWMHAVVEAAGDRLEAWYCFERRIMAQILPDGEIRYQDDLKQILREYSPDANTVTVSRGRPDDLAGMGHSALDFPKNVIKLFEDAGEKIVRDTGKYEGKDVNIFKMSGPLVGMDMEIEMIVDARKNILLFLNQKATDKDGNTLEANGYFDYPETGPESIYDIGVPESAKIVHSEKSEKAETAYDKAFNEAMAIIDSRENWPEPRDLAIAYWEKRNAKEYDELAVLWPGSVTWNERVLKDEEPVEYVFGKARAAEDMKDTLIVPYASKSHFEKHGEYNLKMRLKNEKSAKGRFYIVSGN